MQYEFELFKYYEQLHNVLTIQELLDAFQLLKNEIITEVPVTLLLISDEKKLAELIFTEHNLESQEFTDQEFFDPYYFLKNNALTSFWETVTLPWNEKRQAQGIILLSFQKTSFGYAIIGDNDTNLHKIQKMQFEQLLFEFSNVYVKLLFFEETSYEVQNLKHQIKALSYMAEVLHTLEVEPLLAKIVDISIKIVNAEVAAVFLNDATQANKNELVCAIEWGLTKEHIENIKIKSGIRLIDYVFEHKKPVLINNLTNSDCIVAMNGKIKVHTVGCCDNISLVQNDDITEMKTLIALPLWTKKQKLGVFVVVNSINKEVFDYKDVSVLATALSLASTGLENALLHQEALIAERLANEMKIAQSIQQDLLPKFAPELSNLKIAGKSWSCDVTGGDYYDYYKFKNSNSQTAVMVGDVSGHGIGSALIMAYSKALLQALLKTLDKQLPQLFRAMNELLFEVTPPDLFITFLLAIIDNEKKELVYVSAGHDEPIIRRATGEIEVLEATGPPLGLFPNIDWDISETIKLNQGDIIVFTTDGVWEARNKENKGFSRKRLINLITELSELSPAEIINEIYQHVKHFASPMMLQDDFTIVVCKTL